MVARHCVLNISFCACDERLLDTLQESIKQERKPIAALTKRFMTELKCLERMLNFSRN